MPTRRASHPQRRSCWSCWLWLCGNKLFWQAQAIKNVCHLLYVVISHCCSPRGFIFSNVYFAEYCLFIVIANFVDSEVLHDSMSSAMPGVSPIGRVKLTPGAGLQRERAHSTAHRPHHHYPLIVHCRSLYQQK